MVTNSIFVVNSLSTQSFLITKTYETTATVNFVNGDPSKQIVVQLDKIVTRNELY